MRNLLLTSLALLALAACKEDRAELPQPVEMTAEAVGFYCQMELLNHDGPKGQIHLDGMPAPLFFSQVKDAIAYFHMPEQSHAVRVAYVQDMTDAESWARPGNWIPLDRAIYVIGSTRMGGMGAPEFVPFSTEAAATAFIAKHGGTMRRFDQIAAKDVLTAAAPVPAPDNQSDIAGRLRALSITNGTN